MKKVFLKMSLWITNWKVWIIPLGIGIISTGIDSLFFQPQLGVDLGIWITTVILMFFVVSWLKGIPLLNSNSMIVNPIVGTWLFFVIITGIWIFHLFFHIS